ncbi:MAG: HAD family hydrolase [Clostridia bacterium]|nr:HAD family hydrolase [Clostridia bacterium]
MKDVYQHFIFDLYGTLADIHTDEEDPRLWEQLAWYLNFRGVPVHPDALQQDYLRLCGIYQNKKDTALIKHGVHGPGEMDIRKVWKKLLKKHGADASKEAIEDICRLFRALSIRKLALFDGAAEVLHALREQRKSVFLLTNAQAVFTAPELRYLGIVDAFDGILISSDAGVKKPSPSFFDLLMKQHRLAPSECLMIGNDDLCDCRGAALCGIDSLYLQTEQSPRRLHPLPKNCREIHHITDVISFVSSLDRPNN